MSYTAGEALLLTRVRAISGYDTNNTSRANWLVLNNGKAAYYVILRPGAFTMPWLTYRSYLATYTTIIELWQKYTNDHESHTNLYTHLNEITSSLQLYPHLGNGANSTILDAEITGAPEPQEMWTSGGGPKWLRYSITLTWKQEEIVTFAE